ncbi:hypothetical protein KC361_g270 [Hortaea werneckii]|nr:hypothetical protein KC361_g270 [Hortaea werneckii]
MRGHLPTSNGLKAVRLQDAGSECLRIGHQVAIKRGENSCRKTVMLEDPTCDDFPGRLKTENSDKDSLHSKGKAHDPSLSIPKVAMKEACNSRPDQERYHGSAIRVVCATVDEAGDCKAYDEYEIGVRPWSASLELRLARRRLCSCYARCCLVGAVCLRRHYHLIVPFSQSPFIGLFDLDPLATRFGVVVLQILSVEYFKTACFGFVLADMHGVFQVAVFSLYRNESMSLPPLVSRPSRQACRSPQQGPPSPYLTQTRPHASVSTRQMQCACLPATRTPARLLHGACHGGCSGMREMRARFNMRNSRGG